MDYSYFDVLIDSVLVIDENRNVIYCNEAAASLCESSVRRMTKGKPVYSFISFSEKNLFLSENGTEGRESAYPMTEMKFQLVNKDREGKVQVAIRPFVDSNKDPRWIILVRDVTLEEVLHQKYHKQLDEKQDVIDQLKEAQKKLEDYSKNLEKMVAERTLELNQANTMLSAIMDSLGQGFLVFDQQGTCGSFYTKACNNTLETIPEGKPVWDVLSLDGNDLQTFKMWMQAVFAKNLPFESLKELAPSSYSHSEHRNIRLDYFPIYNDSKDITHLVLVATDWTAEFEASQALEEEKNYAKMITKMVSSRKQFEKFFANVDRTVDTVNRALESLDSFDVNWAFRELHTLEGDAGTLSVAEIWRTSRQAQEVLGPVRSGDCSVQTPGFAKSLMQCLANLKRSKAEFCANNKVILDTLGIGSAASLQISADDLDRILGRLRVIGVADNEIQALHQEFYKVPLNSLFRHFEDTVSIVAEKTGKQVVVEWSDSAVHVDERRFDRLVGAFVHAFRNAIDHGIEPSEDRIMLGKPEVGRLRFRSELVDGESNPCLQIVLSDDGQGIDPDRIMKKLSVIYPDRDFSQCEESELVQFVFDPGFSTREEVGEFSGRGVGMNAIKEEAEALGGTVSIRTRLGEGTELEVVIPLLDHGRVERVAA